MTHALMDLPLPVDDAAARGCAVALQERGVPCLKTDYVITHLLSDVPCDVAQHALAPILASSAAAKTTTKSKSGSSKGDDSKNTKGKKNRGKKRVAAAAAKADVDVAAAAPVPAQRRSRRRRSRRTAS